MPIATDRPAQENSKVWFLDYIKDAFSNTLTTLLQPLNNFRRGNLLKRIKIFKILKF